MIPIICPGHLETKGEKKSDVAHQERIKSAVYKSLERQYHERYRKHMWRKMDIFSHWAAGFDVVHCEKCSHPLIQEIKPEDIQQKDDEGTQVAPTSIPGQVAGTQSEVNQDVAA